MRRACREILWSFEAVVNSSRIRGFQNQKVVTSALRNLRRCSRVEFRFESVEFYVEF